MSVVGKQESDMRRRYTGDHRSKRRAAMVSEVGIVGDMIVVLRRVRNRTRWYNILIS